jgi:acyl carrier protein
MVDRESLRQTLCELYENETGQKPPNMSDDKKMREELGLDSVDVVSLVMQIECKYRIRLTHEELSKVLTVGDLLSLLEAKLAAGPIAAAA